MNNDLTPSKKNLGETDSAEPDNTELDSTQVGDDEIEIRPGMEPLSTEELEAFLARARAQGRTLTSEEQYAIFGPPPETPEPQPQFADVTEMDAAVLDDERLAALQDDFFSDASGSSAIDDGAVLAGQRLVQGVVFDFDHTLAQPSRPLEELLEEGARNAEAYMRSTGMTFDDDFWEKILEARRFSEEKSEEENEEHIADDAMSFLLQFFGYPASKMDPEVLRQAVDLLYAPEMMAWKAAPGAIDMLRALHNDGYKIAILANYNCDRVFQRMVDYAGFRPYLDVCISSASVEYRKPDERFFNLALEHWDFLPYEVTVVGDSLIHDVKGGIELGALTIQSLQPTSAQVVHDNADVADEVKPDAKIERLDEVLPIIRAWAAA